MKKKTLFLIAALLMTCAAASVFFTRQSRAKPMTLRTKEDGPNIINPKNGLVQIRDMSESKNESEFKYLFRPAPTIAAEVRRYGIVVENFSKQSIIGLAVAWRFFPEDGARPYQRRFTKYFVDELMTVEGNQNSSGIIRPRGKKALVAFDGQGFWEHDGFFELPVPLSQEMEGSLSLLNRALNRSKSWNVEIEGVLYADGTMAGTNTSNFLETTRAMFQGARDAVTECAARKNDEILELVQERTKVTEDDLRATFKDMEQMGKDSRYIYERSKLAFFAQLKSITEAQGIDGMIAYVRDNASRTQIPITVSDQIDKSN